MKMKLAISAIIICACSALAFDFGSLAKSVGEAAATSSSSGASSALKARQTAMINNYTAGKKSFLGGYSYVVGALGTSDAATKAADNALKTVQNKTDISYEELGKITNDLVDNTSTSATKNLPSSLSDAAKSKYSEGLGQFAEALKSEIAAGKEAVELAKEAQAVINNGTTLEKVQLASSFEPTIELAKSIPDDIQKMKDCARKFMDIGKQYGIEIPPSIASVLSK